MALTIIENEQVFQPLSFTRIGQSWKGDKVTNTEAQKLLRELRDWVRQYHHEDAEAFKDAIDDLESLFCRVWTEIDESLVRLKRIAHQASPTDQEHLDAALHYLNRWQDRGGKVGNVAPVSAPH